MKKINFEDGQLVKAGYVEIDGEQHEIVEAEYEGEIPISSYILNQMQDNIEEEINNTKEEIEKNVEEEINTIKEQILDYEIVDEW